MTDNVRSINDAAKKKARKSSGGGEGSEGPPRANAQTVLERMLGAEGAPFVYDAGYAYFGGEAYVPGTAKFRAVLLHEATQDPVLRGVTTRTIDEAIQIIATAPSRLREGVIDFADSPAEVELAISRAVAQIENLYERDGMLVRVVDVGMGPFIEPVHAELLTAELGLLLERDAKGTLSPISRSRVSAWLRRRTWHGLRPLARVVGTPIMRADGTVLQEPGYDEASETLFIPACEFAHVPDEPTAEDVDRAVAIVNDLLHDFPFETRDARAGAWSAMISMLRPHVSPVPLHAFDATRPGTGKTLLADVCSIIGTGLHDAPHQAWPEGGQSAREEARKRIDSAMIEGKRLIYFDNVCGTFGDSSITALLTSKTWSGRVLGGSQSFECANGSMLMITSNNATLSADLGRRTVTIRQDARMIAPEARSGFRHRLPEAAVNMRGVLVPALLTVCRAYETAGAPEMDIPRMGSFESYTRHVRAPIAWAGLGDARSVEAMAANMSEDIEPLIAIVVGAVAVVVRSLELTSAQILSAWVADVDGDGAQAIDVAIELSRDLSVGDARKLSAVTLGRLLNKLKGRTTEAGAIRSRRDKHKGNVYSVA